MPQNDITFLKDKKIVLVCHYSNTGFFHHLDEFLNTQKTRKVLFITHPLHPKRDKLDSSFKLSENGKEYLVKKFAYRNIPNLLHFVKDIFLNILWIMKTNETWDLLIAADCLNTISALVLRKIGKVKKVVYYSVDFVPKRFENPLLDKIYHELDKFSVIHANEVWVLSPRMIEGRRKFLGISKKYDKKQYLFPEGVWMDRILRKPFSKISKSSAVFVGHVIQRMGIHLVIDAIPYIKKAIPDFQFVIIGKGEYLNELRKRVKELGLEKNVIFKGFMKDHKEVENLVAACSIGIATYTKDESGLTFYADPAKVKIYMGAGLPVVTTDTFYYAKDIEKEKAGIVAKNDFRDVGKAIISLLESEEKLKDYRENALRYARNFDYPILFSENLKRVLA